MIGRKLGRFGMLALHVLASGSSGNAAVIENTATGAGVLIDCGICKRDFLNRCDEAGFDPGRIQAMFVTHEHGDHVKGLGVVLRGLAKIGNVPPVFAAGACTANSSALAKVAEAFDVRELAAACTLAGGQGIANSEFEDATPHAAVAPAGQGLTARAAGPGAIEAAVSTSVATPPMAKRCVAAISSSCASAKRTRADCGSRSSFHCSTSAAP